MYIFHLFSDKFTLSRPFLGRITDGFQTAGLPYILTVIPFAYFPTWTLGITFIQIIFASSIDSYYLAPILAPLGK